MCGELLSDASHQKLKLTSFEQLGNDEPPTFYVIIVSAKTYGHGNEPRAAWLKHRSHQTLLKS